PGPFEDLIHVDGGASYLIVKVHRVRHKAASIYKLPVAPHRRDSMLGHESHEGCSVFIGQDTRNSEQCVGSLSDHRDDGALELRRFSYFKRLQRQAKGRSRILKVLQYQYI